MPFQPVKAPTGTPLNLLFNNTDIDSPNYNLSKTKTKLWVTCKSDVKKPNIFTIGTKPVLSCFFRKTAVNNTHFSISRIISDKLDVTTIILYDQDGKKIAHGYWFHTHSAARSAVNQSARYVLQWFSPGWLDNPSIREHRTLLYCRHILCVRAHVTGISF